MAGRKSKNKGVRSASTSDDKDRHTTDIKAMFSDILKEIKELKEQNDNFRERKLNNQTYTTPGKKKNIIIKSKDLNGDPPSEINTKVKNILQKLDYTGEYKKATYIGKDRLNNGIVRVELGKMEDKINILKKKINLKGDDCYVDPDLTRQEREIQQKIRRARDERERQHCKSGLPKTTHK
ncbi:hypothetical protein ANN_09535 [Periplaneta americana]|uniref:Uncharacterized protein n=1 Tax=Periplaneta americana TaxID=6978 RepID=A0ABQ8TNT6_PERAM|nr:hypothetical protein ANN_09535 [Periplaneta americana]